MSVTTTILDTPPPEAEVPAPIQTVEQEAVAEVPTGLRPEAQQVADDFNSFLGTAEDAAPAERAADEAKDPAVGTLLGEIRGAAFSRDAVPVGRLVNDAVLASREVKSGWKTSEFWLTVVGLALTNLSVIKIPGKYGQAITDGAALAAYTLSRGIAKKQ